MILDPKNLLNIFFFEIKVKIIIAPARFEFVTIALRFYIKNYGKENNYRIVINLLLFR